MMLRETEHDYVNEDIAMNRMKSDGKTDLKSDLGFLSLTFYIYIFCKESCSLDLA